VGLFIAYLDINFSFHSIPEIHHYKNLHPANIVNGFK